jgi:hypothetical protein
MRGCASERRLKQLEIENNQLAELESRLLDEVFSG